MDQVKLPQPLFEPHYLNMEFIFQKIYDFLKPIVDFLLNPHTWKIIGIVLIVIIIFFLAVIIFSLVRLFEIQKYDKYEINKKINEAVERENRRKQKENPKWHNILTLSESKNESDWRVAIIEADSMLEQSLKEKGIPGETVAELLEAARSNGYHYIQDAWDAHLIRNQIAHNGSEYQLTKIESRRVVRMFQNFFEEIRVI